MNCNQTRKYHFNQNSRDGISSKAVSRHMQQCPACRKFIFHLGRMDNLLTKSPPASPLPEDLHAGIMAAVERERALFQKTVPGGHQPLILRRCFRAPWWILGSAATVLLLLTWMGLNQFVGNADLAQESLPEEVVSTHQAMVETARVSIGITEQSKQLVTLTQADPSGAIYQEEIDGLMNFISSNTRILFARHNTSVPVN